MSTVQATDLLQQLKASEYRLEAAKAQHRTARQELQEASVEHQTLVQLQQANTKLNTDVESGDVLSRLTGCAFVCALVGVLVGITIGVIIYVACYGVVLVTLVLWLSDDAKPLFPWMSHESEQHIFWLALVIWIVLTVRCRKLLLQIGS